MAAAEVDPNHVVDSLLTHSWVNETVLVIGVLVAFAAWLWSRARDRAARAMVERGKADRAAQYEDRSIRLEGEISRLVVSVNRSFSTMTRLVHEFDSTLNNVGTLMAKVSHKLESKLAKRQSLEVIQHEFAHLVIQLETLMPELVVALLAKGARPEHLAKQFKTDMAELLDESHRWLARLPLTQPLNQFFKLDDQSPSRRYVLVDRMWRDLEEVWNQRNRSMPDGQLVAEFKLAVKNTLDDFFSTVENAIKSSPPSGVTTIMQAAVIDHAATATPPDPKPRIKPLKTDDDSDVQRGDRDTDSVNIPGANP